MPGPLLACLAVLLVARASHGAMQPVHAAAADPRGLMLPDSFYVDGIPLSARSVATADGAGPRMHRAVGVLHARGRYSTCDEPAVGPRASGCGHVYI